MNIELQCCALFIIFSISVMFLHEKKLDLMNRRLFQRAIKACFACLIFDILSVILINLSVYSDFDPFITGIVCKIYIMLLVLQGFFGYLYASTSLLPRDRMRAKAVRILSHLIFCTGEIMMLLLPISFTASDRVVYSYGPSTSVAYILSAIYILSTIVITIVYKKHMPGRRFIAMLLWQGIWLLAALVQFIRPELLLVGFASSFGMVILYIQLENPSEYIDGSTGLFNTNALSAYIHDKYRFNKPFSLFTAKIHYLTDNVDYNMEQEAVMRSAKALVSLGPEPAFRIDDDTFCVVYDNSERMFEKAADIKRQKDAVTDLPANGTYLLIPDSTQMSGPDEFFRFLHTYLENEQEITVADDKLVQKLRDQNRIKELIDDALRMDRVVVFFQPFFNVKESCFDTAEALVRIKNEDGSLIPPGEFIPVAEETGQIIPLGIRIFEKVCMFLKKGEADRYGLKQIEANISAAQFDYDNPAKYVLQLTEEYGIDPGKLNLEITETAAARNRDIMLRNMNTLIERGITFSLDDFGTGRSNIDYFVNMPVKIIKFDYSFTHSFFENDKTKFVLTGMVDILHKLNMSVVAEGIETEEQMRVMKDMGVEYLQGYYYSRPLPEDEYIAFLKQHSLASDLQG